MICENTQDLLAEIQKQMTLHKIQSKELAVMVGMSQQSVSQLFKVGNPSCKNLFKICDALNIKIDIYVDESDTE